MHATVNEIDASSVVFLINLDELMRTHSILLQSKPIAQPLNVFIPSIFNWRFAVEYSYMIQLAS